MFLLQQEDYFVESIKPIFIFYFFIFTTICSRQKSGDQLKQKKDREREREKRNTNRQTDRQTDRLEQSIHGKTSFRSYRDRERDREGG